MYGPHNLIEKYFSDVRIDSTGCLELLAWYADDDDDYRIHPGAKEIADDSIDQDCSGSDATSGGTVLGGWNTQNATIDQGDTLSITAIRNRTEYAYKTLDWDGQSDMAISFQAKADSLAYAEYLKLHI